MEGLFAQPGQSIADNCAGETIGVYGRVTDANGHPIAHASIVSLAAGRKRILRYSEAITALYMADDEHIDSDTVFGANESLITEPKPNGSGSPFGPLPSIHFDFTLAAAQNSAEAAQSGRVGADPSQLVKKAGEVH